MYQNPFRESMSYPEARDVLFLEIRKTTDKSRIDRLKADYAAVIPSITKRELDAGPDVLTSYPV